MGNTPKFGGVFAAGGVVVDPQGRIAVIHRPKYDDWCLPKGHLDKGESEMAAAVREVWEETGCLASPQRFLGTEHYMGPRGPKFVFYWLMRLESTGPINAGDEVDQLLWLTFDEALARLSYEGERVMVRLSASHA
jgi:8-oxo-dGTP pyrophosphatase MutT (NUDIX family)